MKKIIALLLALAMALSLVACGGGNDKPVETNAPEAGDTTAAPQETEAPKEGCGSVIGFGAVAILAAAAAAVALKKD